jgi:hypothetical protein
MHVPHCVSACIRQPPVRPSAGFFGIDKDTLPDHWANFRKRGNGMGTPGRPTVIPADLVDAFVMMIQETYEKGDP